MRTTSLVLLLLSATVSAEEFVDAGSGLAIAVPDGWTRDVSRQKQSLKFAAQMEVGKNRYIAFSVGTSQARGFSKDAWLEGQQKTVSRHFAEVTDKFTKDTNTTIGGLDAIGFTIGGKAKQNPKLTMHVRVYAVINGDHYFELTAVSYNGAHKEKADAIDDMLGAVRFQEAQVLLQGKPAEGQPTTHEDPAGNFKLTLPPGWTIEYAAEKDDLAQRIRCERRIDDVVVANFEVWMLTLRNATIFATGTPDQVLQDIYHKEVKVFDRFYGEGAHKMISPQSDESLGLGGAPKAAAYEISSIRLAEMAEVAEAEKKIKKGIKDVKVPDFKPLVIRGRIGMISPQAYMTMAIYFARGMADDPQLKGEIEKIHEDFKFLSTAPKPPALIVAGKSVGPTTTDPALAKERKAKAAVQLQARKAYRCEFTFTLPKGWAKYEGNLGPNGAMLVYAQDADHNWIEIQVSAANSKHAGERNRVLSPIEEDAATWKSNWTGKARGAKVSDKPDKFALGRARGKGYKLLTGRIDRFPGTFRAVASDKFPGKGWRTFITVETRGQPVFEADLKKFLKSLKAKDVKVK